MNETPSVANMSNATQFEAIEKAINNNLATDYKIEKLTEDSTGNLTTVKSANDANSTYTIYKSAKTDAWGNNYYVILDATERHDSGISEFYVTVVSAGPNAQTTISNVRTKDTKGIEADDIFLLVQYTDGDVAAKTYNCASDTLVNGANTKLGLTTKGVAKTGPEASAESTGETVPTEGMQAHYIGTIADKSGLTSLCPVNFQVASDDDTTT
jgi:hypothetical protein